MLWGSEVKGGEFMFNVVVRCYYLMFVIRFILFD